jgi:hypothetical protein
MAVAAVNWQPAQVLYPRAVAPTRVLQGIASAFYGPSSFQGGLTAASAGLAAHFLIAFTAATVFAWRLCRCRRSSSTPSSRALFTASASGW